jgi:hypothetical protein
MLVFFLLKLQEHKSQIISHYNHIRDIHFGFLAEKDSEKRIMTI